MIQLKSSTKVKIVLQFIFSSGKITKFTVGELNYSIENKEIFKKIKEDILQKLIHQMHTDKGILTICNLNKTDNLQIITKNLNQINLYMSDSQINIDNTYIKQSYSIIFNSGKVTKFTKYFKDSKDFSLKVLFEQELQLLVESLKNSTLFVLENEFRSDYLFILPDTIDCFSINLDGNDQDY